ncbi:unnamed protein product [Schistosoma turkestanicum]|nr:unnamed protein product [Schistosoma turkestanicum]
MFLLTGLSEMSRISPSDRYDKLGLLSNSYSFLWETNNTYQAMTVISSKTNVNTNFMYDYQLYKKESKHKSLLLILYSATKHKIEKTFTALQTHYKTIHKTNYSFDKQIDSSSSIPVQVNHITDMEHIIDSQQNKTYSQSNVVDPESHIVFHNDSLHSMDSSNYGRIIHRKHIKYRRWKKDKTKWKYKLSKDVRIDNYKKFFLQQDYSSQHIHFECLSRKMSDYYHETTSNIHKQFLFSQTINEGQWEAFLFLLNTGININSIQRKIKSSNDEECMKQEAIITEVYPSVLDLYLRNIPSYLSSYVVKSVLTHSVKENETTGIYSRILSCLLDNGADVCNIDDFELSALRGGGIQSHTISYICEQTAIQLHYSFMNVSSATTNHQTIDYAGLLRQLLKSRLIPTKLFFYIHTDKILIDVQNVLIINNIHLISNKTDRIYEKNKFYPLLLYELMRWNFYHSKTSRCLSSILQSFIVLFLNLVYSGLCKLPENLCDVIDCDSYKPLSNHQNYKHNHQEFFIETYHPHHHHHLSYFSYYHNKFLQIINKQPFSLFVQCRYVIRNQIGTQYFYKKLMHSEDRIDVNIELTSKFCRQLIKLPDQLKRAIGYMEAVHLKDELYYLTQTP